ncbi:MAG: hypothetical protein RM049_32735 [Nostoc sp. DedQUE04]|uniref:hypothetical protein n=1 Tax=Nostoc sp. DedQUE04 TaxID=3075390 RepID=UPI002AD37C28|nr:hypothetical protein [Nostoc sp. DedQUE04]MDZ8140005.1 hypothetical protein [Nostoc sp. DedQUE04]
MISTNLLFLSVGAGVRSQFIPSHLFILAVIHSQKASHYSSVESKQIFYNLRNCT